MRLPCLVDMLEGFVLLWKKGTSILTVQYQVIDQVSIVISQSKWSPEPACPELLISSWHCVLMVIVFFTKRMFPMIQNNAQIWQEISRNKESCFWFWIIYIYIYQQPSCTYYLALHKTYNWYAVKMSILFSLLQWILKHKGHGNISTELPGRLTMISTMK